MLKVNLNLNIDEIVNIISLIFKTYFYFNYSFLKNYYYYIKQYLLIIYQLNLKKIKILII